MRKRHFFKMKFQSILEHSTATLLILLYLQGVVSQVDAQSESPLRIDVSDGEDTLLECRFSPQLSKKASTLFWIRTNRKGHDNVAIGNTPYQRGYTVEHHPEKGMYDLRISKATYDRDNGKFECRMKEGGTGVELYSKSVELTVKLKPSEPTITPKDMTATEGRPLNLTCSSIGGSPPPQIYWYIKGQSKRLQANLIEGITKDEPTRSILTIIPMKEDDSSIYRCTVWNRALGSHQKLEASTQIFVNYFPRVSVGPENPLKVEKDDTARLECKVDAKPRVHEVKWTRMIDGRYIGTNFNHTIPRVTLQDSGTYKCSAKNGLGQPGKEELKLDVLYAPVVTLADRKEANEGEDVEINCQVSSNPRPTKIQWLKEGVDSVFQNGPTLRLSNVKAKHNGRYMCSASNFIKPSGKEEVMRMGNATIEVNVRHKPGKTAITPSNPIAIHGTKITLKCESKPSGYPVPQYKWWKDGSPSNLAVGSEFTIESVRLNNAGRYYCQPSNNLGEGTEAYVDLDVHQAPKIITPLQPTIIKREQDSGFQITCSAHGKPKPKIKWFKDGEEILDSESAMYQITNSEQQTIENKAYNVLSTLKFQGFDRIKHQQLMHTDGGSYTCQFENDVSKAESTMVLRIEHSPVLVHQHNKVAFDPRSTAYISCKMKAYPMPKFDWSFGNSVVNDRTLYKQTTHNLGNDVYEGILKINTVTEGSYDDYTCKATNRIGTLRTIIKLQPKGKPEKPSNIRAFQRKFNSILIGWDNGFNGGYNDTKYTIQYRRHGDNQPSYTECLQRNPCNLTGLNQHSQYYISVKANNDKGESKYSKEATVLTKVDVAQIPKPEQVHFELMSSRASFHVKNRFLPLIAQIELKNKETGNHWAHYKKLSLGDSSIGEIQVNSTKSKVKNLRVRLCLETNDALCGDYAKASIVDKLPNKTALSMPWVIAVVILVALAGVIAILLVIKCCCCKSQNGRNKKEIGKERPTIIHSTQPPFGHGIENKGVDTLKDADEILKNNLYSAQQNGYEQQSTSNTNSANGGSVNSQDSLWNVKGAENNAAMMIQHNQNGYPMHPQQQMQQQPPYGHQGYDQMQQYQQQPQQQPQQQQGYPEEYAHYPYPDEYLNERNQQFLANNGLDPYGRPMQRPDADYSPYGDVSGIPDPYNGGQIEEPQTPTHFYNGHGQQMSFEDAIEGSGQNGYITPNSKSKRIVREIIV